MTLDELEKLADEATPGPWSNRELENMEDCILGPDNETWVLYNDEINTMKQEDSDFVTAANPQTIKRLIALCRMQNEALRVVKFCVPPGQRFTVKEALATYEEFGK